MEEILSTQPDGGQGSARFSAVLGDIRQPIYRDATVICLCNIMFGGALNACILANVLSRCPACSTVASIVQLHHPRLRKRKVVNVGCTWASKGVSWTIYTVLPPILRAVRHVRHNLRGATGGGAMEASAATWGGRERLGVEVTPRNEQ